MELKLLYFLKIFTIDTRKHHFFNKSPEFGTINLYYMSLNLKLVNSLLMRTLTTVKCESRSNTEALLHAHIQRLLNN